VSPPLFRRSTGRKKRGEGRGSRGRRRRPSPASPRKRRGKKKKGLRRSRCRGKAGEFSFPGVQAEAAKKGKRGKRGTVRTRREGKKGTKAGRSPPEVRARVSLIALEQGEKKKGRTSPGAARGRLVRPGAAGGGNRVAPGCVVPVGEGRKKKKRGVCTTSTQKKEKGGGGEKKKAGTPYAPWTAYQPSYPQPEKKKKEGGGMPNSPCSSA